MLKENQCNILKMDFTILRPTSYIQMISQVQKLKMQIDELLKANLGKHTTTRLIIKDADRPLMLDDHITIQEITEKFKACKLPLMNDLNIIQSNGQKFLIIFPGFNRSNLEGGISSYYDSPEEDDLIIKFKDR